MESMAKRLVCVSGFLTVAAFGAAAQDGFIVDRVDIADRKAVFGTVRSIDVIDARARIAGTVGGLAVDEGSLVDAEAVLATVGDPKLTLRLTALDARLASLDAQEKLAKIELDRLTRLRKSGAASQSRLDEAQTNLDVINSNRAALVAERAVIAQQQAEGAVLAPAAGRVLRVHVAEGSVILPGEPLATIATEHYVLRIELPERHARFIEQGDTVMVGERGLTQTESMALESLTEGVIRQVYPEMSNGRVIADVTVEGLGDYFVGERARVYVAAGRRSTILVPSQLLRQRYGVTYVRVKGSGEVMIQPGQVIGDRTEILSGLRSGDILLQP